ncbi:MAG: hybrid sensor histidine kinase/response regulator [Proteobacteria bacterium SG_bin5]|nr:response regulator [Sphingomonas sp.]OQW39718.1 MAG: hybrid sensor histidine kinase/response regulator [Proteobacteria bacterium SG_bin5]
MASLATAPPSRTPALIALLAGLGAGGLILWAAGDWRIAAGFAASALLGLGLIAAAVGLRRPAAALAPERDWGLACALADVASEAIAVTDHGGRLVCANEAYQALFAGLPTPPNLPLGETLVAALADAGRAAWRDGLATAKLALPGGEARLSVARVGTSEELLVWRIAVRERHDLAGQAETLITGPVGARLGSAGVMIALLSPEGRVRAANPALAARAAGEGAIDGRDFAQFLATDAEGRLRFAREGERGTPLRLVQLPFLEGERAPLLIALLDEEAALGAAGGAAAVQALVGLLPFGIALVDREGRFVEMNPAFRRAAMVDPAAPPLYPGDLVVREDKAALADAVRRFANGASHAAEIAVRLRARPEDAVSLTLAGARGLGEAAVLLALKDSGEEGRLKREVAQATKMQAVGQLAGGVAHDFNNILTAIIGHCDLMLMRHAPGDSDYDDIQQIRANSNRAASLTRQLLAFSRQQTLRPQVLQLPDVISEVSALLKRLLGETVRLEVTHGRALGAVRADPGQLEQVVMNLAVNARDAILAKPPRGGGVLRIETFAVSAQQVRKMGADFMPAGDYTALAISDNGSGIPPDVLPKIFEPFFTTKEVGKGTGLGLSTVYGIVKQSGGYIFADSVPGEGARFTIYLPVHRAEAPAKAPRPAAAKPAELWGTGTILLVEDEDMVRAVAERALTRQGYKVLVAEHGEAALELLGRIDKPDLLVSDVVMPQMDGPTLVRQARARYPDLPILFMSGYAEEQLRKSIDLANVAFLPKPFSVQQLAEAVRNALAAR